MEGGERFTLGPTPARARAKRPCEATRATRGGHLKHHPHQTPHASAIPPQSRIRKQLRPCTTRCSHNSTTQHRQKNIVGKTNSTYEAPKNNTMASETCRHLVLSKPLPKKQPPQGSHRTNRAILAVLRPNIIRQDHKYTSRGKGDLRVMKLHQQ